MRQTVSRTAKEVSGNNFEMETPQFEDLNPIFTFAQKFNVLPQILSSSRLSKITHRRNQHTTGPMNTLLHQFLITPSILFLLINSQIQTGEAFEVSKIDSQSSSLLEGGVLPPTKDQNGLLMSGAKELDLPPPPPPFIQEPEDTWVVRHEPIKIYCSARNVMKIAFFCDGMPVSSKSQTTNVIDPDTKSYITLSREEVVDSGSGQLLIQECFCSVWVGVNEVKQSRTAKIRIASLKKDFLSEPVSKKVEVGSSVELQCRPPEGEPTPKVYWLKDKVPIQQQQTNQGNHYVIGEQYPTLMITEAQFADTGEYICVAENVFNYRESYPARLHVYENGGWSSWSKWSECSSECGRGILTRTRTCTNPPPVNGKPCEGKANETADCTIMCHHGTDTGQPGASGQGSNSGQTSDEGWGQWGQWSPCSTQCTQSRTRDCTYNTPGAKSLGKEGGSSQKCQGASIDQRNCSGDHCTLISLGTVFPPYNKEKYDENGRRVDGSQDSNLALYFGLITIVGLFIIVVLVIVFFIQRRSKYGFGAFGCGSSSQHASYLAHEAYHTEGLALSGKYHESLHMNTRFTSPRGMVPVYPEEPINIEPHCIARGKVGYAGGRLCIPDSRVSLLIPEGAIPRGTMQDVYIAVCRDDRQIPNLSLHNPKTTLLSPTIICGPPGLKLKKPVILSFEHAARATMYDWQLNLLAGPNWGDCLPVNDLQGSGSNNNGGSGQGNSSGDLFCQVDNSACYVMSDVIRSQYCLIGSQLNAATLVTKSLKCAAFCCLPPMGPNTPGNKNGASCNNIPSEINIRLYCIPNYRDSWEFVIELERQLGGTLLATPIDLDLVSYAEALSLHLTDLSPGWRTKTPQQEIPFEHLWNKISCHTQHASFVLFRHTNESNSPVSSSLESLACNITLGQRSFAHNNKCTSIKFCKNHLITVNNNLTMESFPDPSNLDEISDGGTISECPSMLVFRLSNDIRQRMIETFDKNHGKNWYHLAAMMKLDQFQTYFATKHSPTEHLLNLWEARHRDRNSIKQLIDILKSLAQYEIATLLERELSDWI